ncbi:MAG: 50S ribosomal protein L11 [Candidatus Jidaibacter sp.]|nr:50S ribosomal protein L11 [Candidatus Jidaibacter sp.]
MKKKEVLGTISLLIEAGKANPSPPVGPALGQRGLNIMDFCKKFNDECVKLKMEIGVPVPVVISYYADKSFTLEIKQPPVSILVKKKLKLPKGSKKSGTEFVGAITSADAAEIAKIKLQDMGLGEGDLEAGVKMVEGTCRSMGVKVEG